MGYKPFKSKSEVCEDWGKVISCPYCGGRVCKRCINKTAWIRKKCPNCGERL